MIRRPPRSTRTDTRFPTRRSSDLLLLHSLLDDLGDTAVVDERRYLLDVVDRAELDELLRPRGHGGDILRLRVGEGEVIRELSRIVKSSTGRVVHREDVGVSRQIGRASCRERVCQYV